MRYKKKDNPTYIYAAIRHSSNGHKKQKMDPCKSCHEHTKQTTSQLVILSLPEFLLNNIRMHAPCVMFQMGCIWTCDVCGQLEMDVSCVWTARHCVCFNLLC